MAQRTYTCAEVSIPHADMLGLKSAGDLNLGIGDDVALEISTMPELKPAKISFARASRVRNWIAVGVFAYSVYLSVTAAWWYVLFGSALMLFLGRSHKKLTIEKILGAAEIDPAFYEAHRTSGAWLYRIDEAKAAPFLKSERGH